MSQQPRLSLAGLAGVVLAVALVGCGQTIAPPEPQPSAVPSLAPSAAAVGLEPMADAGRLEIRLGGASAYRVQATVDQVKTLRVTLSGSALSSSLVKEVTTSQLSGGKGTVAFEGVPKGNVNVKIEAIDGGSAVIGRKETTAEIVGGQTAVVAVALKLDATHVASDKGNMQVELELQNGDVVVDPIASPSPRPTSPILSPTPAPTPTPLPDLTLSEGPTPTWWKDGTMSVAGVVKNNFSVPKTVTLAISFEAKNVFGYKRTIEVQTLELGELAAGATKAFDVRSTKRIGNGSLMPIGDGFVSVGNGIANVGFKHN